MAKNYHYIRWNKREDKMLLNRRKKGYSFYKIATEFGVSTESVKQRYRKIKPKQKNVNNSWSYVI